MTTSYRFNLGEFTIFAMTDGHIHNKAEHLFAGADPDGLAAALGRYNLDPDGIPSYFNPMLIDTGQHRVLLDSGVGEFNSAEHGFLLQNLDAAGIAPADIDAVVISHAHPDHVDANTDTEGNPLFPNARYFIWRSEWEYWTRPELLENDDFRGPIIRRNLLGIQDRFELLDSEDDILPCIRIVATPGHTPGHIAVLIQSGGESLIYAGDATINPIHLEYPDWCYYSDTDYAQATESRRKLARLAREHNAIYHAYHFIFPALGRLNESSDSWRWEPIQE